MCSQFNFIGVLSERGLHMYWYGDQILTYERNFVRQFVEGNCEIWLLHGHGQLDDIWGRLKMLTYC